MSFLSNALFVIAVLPMGVVAIDMFIIVMNAAADDDEETKPRQSGRGLLRTKRGNCSRLRGRKRFAVEIPCLVVPPQEAE